MVKIYVAKILMGLSITVFDIFVLLHDSAKDFHMALTLSSHLHFGSALTITRVMYFEGKSKEITVYGHYI